MRYIGIFIISAFVSALLIYPAGASVVFTDTHTFTGAATTNAGTNKVSGGNVGTDLSAVISNIFFDFTSIKQISSITSYGSIPYCVAAGFCSYDGTSYGANTHGGLAGSNIIKSANVSNIVTKQVPFTATVDGQLYGTGGIGWQTSPPTVGSNYFNYFIVFDSVETSYANTLTGGKTIVFAYDTTVYSNYWSYNYLCTFSCGEFTWTAGSLLRIHTIDGKTTGGYTVVESVTNDVVTTTFNTISNTFGYFNVSKNNANMLFNLTNATGTTIYQTTSTNNIAEYVDYKTGLSVYSKHVLLGLWNNFTIFDASGNLAPTPPGQAGTNQTNITKPSTGVNIVFDKSSYVVVENVNISYWFSDTEWSALGFKYMNIYLDDVLQPEISGIFNHGLTAQSGFYIYPATKKGTLKAEVVREIPFISTNIWDASVNIYQTGTIFTSNTILTTKTSYNTTENIYIYGALYPVSNEQNTGYVKVLIGGSGTTVREYSIDALLSNSFNFSTTLNPGNYQAYLYGYLNTNDCAGTTGYAVCYVTKGHADFNVVNNSGVLAIEWITDGTLTNTTTKLNTFPSVSWTNTTANDIVTIYDNSRSIYKLFYINNSGSYVCPYCSSSMVVQIPDDVKYLGTWYGRISNGSNISDYVEAYLNVVPASSVNFTNNYSISMYWDKDVGKINEPRKLYWNTGSYLGNYQVKIIDGSTGNSYITWSFTSTAQILQSQVYTPRIQTIYQAQFLDSNNNIQQVANLIINTGITTTATTTPSTGQQKANDIAGLLDSNLFWALIFTVGLMIAVAIASRKKGEE